MRWFWDCYLGPDGDPDHPYASVLRAPDLSGLAPAMIVTAECDPLRDEGEEYAKRLAAAGVEVTARRWDGMIHGFAAMYALIPEAETSTLEIAEFLRRHF
jgi:acetyl esterase